MVPIQRGYQACRQGMKMHDVRCFPAVWKASMAAPIRRTLAGSG